MINPSELRLGNYFRDKLTGRILIVDAISRDRIIFDQQGDALPDGWQAQPVPISEEWLQRNGFKSSGFANYKTFYNAEKMTELSLTGNYAYYRDDPRSRPFITIDGDKIWLDRMGVAYVHQLQNLYFALTSQELVLKLPI